MPTDLPTPATASDEAGARPYGIIGLILSLVAILCLATLLCALAMALLFGSALALFGWQLTIDRIVHLDPSGGTDEAFREKLAVVVSLVLYAALSASVLLVACWRGGRRWSDLIAWRPWSPISGAPLLIGLVVVVLIYSLCADALIAHFVPAFKDMVHMPKGLRWVALFVALAAVAAPITEELLFRGWLYTGLRNIVGIWPAILSTAVLFALAHWENTHLYALAVFPVGLALGYLRERTGSIKATITFHALYNGVASMLLYVAQ